MIGITVWHQQATFGGASRYPDPSAAADAEDRRKVCHHAPIHTTNRHGKATVAVDVQTFVHQQI